MERQRIYELLGAPVLVYRHKPSHLGDGQEIPFCYDARSLQKRLSAPNRVRSRFYYEVDQSFRQELGGKKRKKKSKGRGVETQPQKDECSGENEGSNHNGNEGTNGDDSFWDNEEFLMGRIRPILLNARQGLLSSDPDVEMILKRYKLLDHPYIPAPKVNGRKGVTMKGEFHMDRWKASQELSIERRNTELSYLAPFSSSALLEFSKKSPGSENSHTFTRPIDELDPNMYGNCLVCLLCPCCQDRWLLIHRSGKNLSKVCIGKLSLPQGLPDDSKNVSTASSIDVGNRILQIAECGTNHIVVRTLRTVTLISLVRMQSGNTERGCVGVSLKTVCETHLETHSTVESLVSLAAVCHPNYGNDLVAPKFAALSRSLDNTRYFIHHLYGDGDPVEHRISNLRTMELIDFSCANPMVLWSAATSYVRPALVEDFCTSRLSFGHGSSLFTVDLRSNDAIFQWSPSQAEFVTEGVHSISGILTDWNRTHTIWASSLSAGRMWEIDGRMPCRHVTSWSIPDLAKDSNTIMPEEGLHGYGTILIQPSSTYYTMEDAVIQPVLRLDKTPGAGRIDLYQRPEVGPRFQTPSLECSAAPGLSSSDDVYSSIAFSSVFPLVESSQSIFPCGLACFRSPVSKFLTDNQVRDLHLSYCATDVLCTITTNSNGDLYAHTLLECSTDEERKSAIRRDLPIGCSMLIIPEIEVKDDVGSVCSESALKVTLSNEVSVSIDTHLSPVVLSRRDCRKFSTIYLEQLPSQSAESQLLLEPDVLETISHPENVIVHNEKNLSVATTVKLGSSLKEAALANSGGVECKSPKLSSEDADGGRSDLNKAVLEAHEESWNCPSFAVKEETTQDQSASSWI